ncbi:MAG: DNA mismatch repair protein MutS [Chitinophagaceae bacterium]|nr:DNA mismatch repair protein MutS [Chitinophagaceae bacterium]
MEVDSTTYSDLSVFHHEPEFSIYHKVNFTKTDEGRDWLLRFFRSPFSDAKLILETQTIIKRLLGNEQHWPTSISNGTLMVMSRFFESTVDTIPSTTNYMEALSYKVFHSPDFSLVRYSLTHFADFLRGMRQMIDLFDNDDSPPTLRIFIQRAKDLIGRTHASELASREAGKTFSYIDTIKYGRYIRYEYKNQSYELMSIYGRLDAWHSMAIAMKTYNLSMPAINEDPHPYINAKGLYHILLPSPVPYDIEMNIDSNFIFLTGANMAGKSTFIKAVGSAVFLAHVGMGVPATAMKLTVFDGLLSNINVVDNIVKGESYFFNEVQRIKNTILKINDGRKWLVLIDELFKGTNVQDAMKCSSTVVKGLIKITSSLFILSTHLYEIGEELRAYPNISFKYFETSVLEDQLKFSYQLKDGISNDRIGYVILKREKVVEMLEKL